MNKAATILKTLKVRLKDKHASLLKQWAFECNQVWNEANPPQRSVKRQHKSPLPRLTRNHAMNNQPSPLETLAAFAIVFAAGVVSTATLGTYIGYLRRKAAAHLSQSAERDEP